MAQREMQNSEKKGRPASLKFYTSSSQTVPSSPPDQTKLNSNCRVNSPTQNDKLSDAERYVRLRSEELANSFEQADSSPESPLSMISSSTSPIIPFMSHAELMYRWRQQKANEINKKQKYRYSYTTPSPPSLGFPFIFPLQKPISTQSIDSNTKKSTLTNR